VLSLVHLICVRPSDSPLEFRCKDGSPPIEAGPAPSERNPCDQYQEAGVNCKRGVSTNQVHDRQDGQQHDHDVQHEQHTQATRRISGTIRIRRAELISGAISA
jgi:hypothetical protein